MKHSRVRMFLGLAMFVMLPHLQIMLAQVVNGTILGTVRDPNAAVLPGVSISAKNLETGAVRSAQTDSSGNYQILSIPAGDYQLEASLKGFNNSLRRGVSVTVGAAVTVNFDLVLGTVQQEVEVTSDSPQVNTINASMGGLVGEQAVRELPL